MALILKCKICGGDIELNDEKGIGTCLYCGSTMTFPKVSNEQKVSMFNRGNHFRRLGEFDQALTVYEQIIKEEGADAEAHWCAALSRFGIEYVEDPSTMEYLPTCHRASFDSFLDDIDVKAAIDNSDGITKRQYQKEALKIEEVRQGILATSSKEDPFDVFICYKETDQNGGRTPDSVLAQDIYDRLTEKGYKVFFSRITLEDRVGTEYEPYIFAALNSAKAMIVVGTSKENLDAVWVKNEWSRFLALMKKDRDKVILPCYKDMDPYDMPEVLSILQSYNMASIGFIQDLIRGIDKIFSKKDSNTKKGRTDVGFDINAYRKRAEDFLRNGDFKKAVSYSEQILDSYPECTEVYLIELCAAVGVCKKWIYQNPNAHSGMNNHI
ncbi:MAG: toll/interleukin-1 receptor domain-containing protein [Lachnospiraceae bacterium]|nr:toll/interleukin-1 receptor domain-containing protein [Lachnospiraceae bacterium]